MNAELLEKVMKQHHTEKGDPVDVMNLAAMVAVHEMLETPNEQGQGRFDSVAGRPSPAPDC